MTSEEYVQPVPDNIEVVDEVPEDEQVDAPHGSNTTEEMYYEDESA